MFSSIATLAARHWFWVLLPLWLAATLNLRASLDWSAEARMGETVILFDWCVLVPLLYAACYWRTLSRRALMIRVVGLVCSGIWLAGFMIPDESERVLRQVSWLRYAGAVPVLLVEGTVLIAMIRVLFSERPDTAELERKGIPPLLARLIVLEARFWRWVWSRLRGR